MARRVRAIGYVRVSTAEQVNGFGLEVQERAIRDWAKREEVRLLALNRDEGLSGSNGLDTRPGLAEALARLERGDAEVLVVYRFDRLARDLVLQETTIQRLQAHKVRVQSVTEPELESSDDATRTMVRQVLGVIAQYERAVIRARMRAGREAKRAKGGYVYGRPAYGFRAESGELVRDQKEQEAIALARRLHKRGDSLRRIAGELDRRGYVPKEGKRWHATQVSRIVA